jgi:hypothetical protein
LSGKGVRAFLVATGLVTIGLFGLVWRSSLGLESARQEAAAVADQILIERARLENTPELEQEVLVFREISGRMAAILPDEAGLNDLVRSLQGFSEQSGVEIRSLRRAAPRGDAKRGGDLRAVSYTLELEGDAFELLRFIDLVETNDRFLRIPRFEVDAARQQELAEGGQLSHSIRLDVETFVFEPGAEGEPVAIEWADWKLERLRGEVSRRRTGLEPAEYEYRGRRGRRDPWVDPRHRPNSERVSEVPSTELETSALSASVSEAWSSWRTLDQTTSALEEAGLSEELEVEVVRLEADARRLLEAERARGDADSSSLTVEIVDSLRDLRAVLDEQRGNRGPSIARLREVSSAMRAHAALDQHALALEALAPIAPELEWLAKDKDRAPYVEALRSAAKRSQAVIDFDAMGYRPRGVVVLGDRAAVLVGACAVMAGDRIKDEIIVRSVTSDEVVFEFRGVVIKRRVPFHSPETWER